LKNGYILHENVLMFMIFHRDWPLLIDRLCIVCEVQSDAQIWE